MKNNFNFFCLVIYFVFCLNLLAHGNEQFNFDVTEIEINENGNEIKGLKRGKISTNEGLTIDADTFKFNKILNQLHANGNIIIKDVTQNITIFAEKISYDKDKEIIVSEGNVRLNNDSIKITANKILYLKLDNIISAEEEVIVEDKLKDLDKVMNDIQTKLNSDLLKLPNLPMENVPKGTDSNGNIQIRSWGEKPTFSFKPKTHLELNEKLSFIDLLRGSKISGSGFPLFTGQGAKLERRLINAMVDHHCTTFNSKEVLPPVLMTEESIS